MTHPSFASIPVPFYIMPKHTNEVSFAWHAEHWCTQSICFAMLVQCPMYGHALFRVQGRLPHTLLQKWKMPLFRVCMFAVRAAKLALAGGRSPALLNSI